MKKAQDKKKQLKVPAKEKLPPAKGAGDVAKDKEDLGAMLRPDKAASDAGKIEVGAVNDKAEKEADAVADAVVKPEAKTEKSKADGEEPESPEGLRPAIRGPPALKAPEAPMIRRLVADQNGNQPNTDQLSAVPAVDEKLAEVGVSASEEAEFDEMSGNDFSVLGDGQSSVMMKAATSQTGPRPDYLPSSLAQLVRRPGQGMRLPQGVRTLMERRLGVDLGDVRVHGDKNARVLAGHVQARAFAFGRHIFLKNPADANNVRLMAHEAAHCIQQGAARPLCANRNRAPPAQKPQATPASPRAPPGALRRFDEDGDDGWIARGAERLADRLDSYQLLKVLIGRRLFTGATVRQDAMSYVGAFMKFIGADETFEQMKQSGSLERGFQAIRDGADKYDLNWPRVKNMFARAYDDFEWTSPIASIKRIFSPFFSDLLAFGKLILKVVAELVAEAFVIGFGPMGKEVWEKIKAIGAVIGLVLADPLGFAMNLIRSVALGIKNFGLNILTHIKKGLLAWVLGPFVAMGVQLPDKLDIKGIINVLLQVLGLTYPQLRPRIIRKLNPRGELKVTLVEKLIEVINILRTEGIAGIWRKFIEYVENLQMTVINGIRDWVIKAAITAGIRKLVAWSNPAGALLDILFTIYKLIVFFVEKFQQILSFATSVFESIGKIARGQLNDAARYIENTLSLTIPIMISFLTSLLGLPDIAGSVRKIITDLRAKVHAAVDKVLDFIIKKVKKLIAKLIGKFKSKAGEPENGVNMQGTQHKLAFEREGRKRRLYMHSEKTETTADGLKENNAVMRSNCKDPITSKTLPEMEGAEGVLNEHEKLEDQLSRKPESNASSPDNNKKREETVTKLKTHLETGTDQSIRATEAVASGGEDVDQQPSQSTLQEGEQVAEDQKENVEPDMEDIRFRYVIVPEESRLEASWGPWADMTGKRETFKTQMKDQGLEARYAVDLDHNPEYQILWRLGHLEYLQDQRSSGEKSTVENRIYPKISEFYNHEPLTEGNKRDRKASDKDFVMAIRYDVHRELSNTQTPNVAEFNNICEYSPSQQAFVPKRDKTADAIAKGWASPIDSMAQTHQGEVDASYAKMFEDSFVSDETLASIRSSGPAMVANAGMVVAGNSPAMPNGEEAAGHLGGIGMQRDPVDAELVTGDYGKLAGEIAKRAPVHGKVFDKHHLIEKSILAKVQEHFSNVKLLPSVQSPDRQVAGINLSGKGLGEVAGTALGEAKVRIPALADADMAAEQTTLLADDGFSEQTAFKAGSVESGGYAISVLKVVNGLLGSQPVANVDAAISSTLSGSLNARAAAMRDAVKNGYTGLSVPEDAAAPDATAALGQATKDIRTKMQSEANEKFQADLKTALPGVLDTLATNAHGDFASKMQNSLQQTHPVGAVFPPGSEAFDVYQNLKNRFEYGPGKLDVVKRENRTRWLAA